MIYHSFLGTLYIEEGKVSAFCGQKPQPETPNIKKLAIMLDKYFAKQPFNPLEALEGINLPQNQMKVLYGLVKIPFGTTVAYGDFTEAIGSRGVRSTATFIGKNPLPVIVPCHRVIKADGSIGNFSFLEGEKTKKALIEFERSTTLPS